MSIGEIYTDPITGVSFDPGTVDPMLLFQQVTARIADIQQALEKLGTIEGEVQNARAEEDTSDLITFDVQLTNKIVQGQQLRDQLQGQADQLSLQLFGYTSAGALAGIGSDGLLQTIINAIGALFRQIGVWLTEAVDLVTQTVNYLIAHVAEPIAQTAVEAAGALAQTAGTSAGKAAGNILSELFNQPAVLAVAAIVLFMVLRR